MRQCWTMQMDARLRERLGAGDTAAEAARALGVTRNAVIGRAGSLKVKIGSRASAATAAARNAAAAKFTEEAARRGGRRVGALFGR